MTSLHPAARSQQPAVDNRPQALLAASVALLILLALAAWGLTQLIRPVAVVVDGQESLVYTWPQSAPDLLAWLGYAVQAQDQVIAPPGRLGPGDRILITRARPVLAQIDGRERLWWTQATSVGELLAEQGILLGWKDLLWLEGVAAGPEEALPPAVWQAAADAQARPWQAVAAPLHLRIRRSVAMTLIDHHAAPATIVTTADRLDEALAAEEVPIFPGDRIFPPLDTAVQAGLRVVIQRATPFQVQVMGETLAARTHAPTVAAALAEAGILLMGMDQVQPPLTAALRPHMQIQITRVRQETVYEEEWLPFETVWAPDPALPIDQRRVADEGGPGLLRHRYRVRYEDDQEVARVQEDSWQVAAPRQRVIAYGTLVAPQTLETPEGVITYWRKMRVYTTSYSPARSGTPRTAPWYGRTRLGMTLAKGIVAVDPGVINMQQRLYVPGYGMAIAGDTGGGVQGRHIDLGFSDDDYQSWHWWSDIYLLWPPPPAYAINYVLPNWPRYPDRGN